jgi:hypothetical protein
MLQACALSSLLQNTPKQGGTHNGFAFFLFPNLPICNFQSSIHQSPIFQSFNFPIFNFQFSISQFANVFSIFKNTLMVYLPQKCTFAGEKENKILSIITKNEETVYSYSHVRHGSYRNGTGR